MISKKYVFIYSYDHEYDKTPVVEVFETELDTDTGLDQVGTMVEQHKFTDSECHWIDNREGRTFLGQSSWYEILTTEDNWQTQFPETIVQKLESLPEYERLEI